MKTPKYKSNKKRPFAKIPVRGFNKQAYQKRIRFEDPDRAAKDLEKFEENLLTIEEVDY